MPRQATLAAGFGIHTQGAMEMLLASVSLKYQVIDQRIFAALITMALATSMLSSTAMQLCCSKCAPTNLDTCARQT